MLADWIRDRPARPDPKGQAAAEQVQEELIREVDEQANRVIETMTRCAPDLAMKVEEAARQRKLQLEEDLITRRHARKAE